MSEQQISTLGSPPPARDRSAWLAGRILAVVAEGMPCYHFERGRMIPGRRGVGALQRWVVRQGVGGRVSSGEFAAAVESLLAGGRLLEVWLERPDRRVASHLLVLPGRSAELPRTVACARGLADVLAAEPWARSIAAESAGAAV